MGFPLLHLDHGRWHSCISNRIYTLFPRDSSTMGEDPDDIPNSVWDENSVFLPPRSQGTYHQQRFASAVFAAATAGTGPRPPLRVRGRDVDEAADRFTEFLDDAGSRGDYTNILVEDRAFGL